MTIDETIVHAREVANEQKRRSGICVQNDSECDKFSACLKYAEEHKQLAEWLEELKTYKEIGTVEECRNNVLDILKAYNKAIDDFANGISEYLGVENATKYGNKNAEQQRISYDTLMKYEIADAIDDIAEQLKAGVTND